ncbi:MAG: glycosyl hydrolase family 28-related protein [Desulfitobacteriaceae bacterium]
MKKKLHKVTVYIPLVLFMLLITLSIPSCSHTKKEISNTSESPQVDSTENKINTSESPQVDSTENKINASIIPTTSIAKTKQEILNTIESLQVNSTENELTASINELLRKDSTDNNKNQLLVNIKDYGAKGNGVDSDVDALKKAIGYANGKGGGSIFFPATTQAYVIDRVVTISKNINLIGEQTRISRYHNYKVNNGVFNFLGNNKMEGFIYDGGLTKIPNLGIENEFTNYSDFVALNEGCIFTNNVFLNAKGSFIGGRGKTIIFGNTFGDYGDHCIYMGGLRRKDGTEDKTEKVIISNNTFTSLTSTRDAVKFRNSGEMVIVANNTFDLPKGSLFNFSLGDTTNLQGNIKNISFSFNIIKKCKDVGFIGLNNTPIGSTLGKLNNIKISNNIVDSCTGYLLIGGSSWSMDTNYNYFSGTNIDISNNTFKTTPQIHLSCKGDGLTVNIANNKAYGSLRNESLIMMAGNTSLNLINNMFIFDDNTTLIDSPFQHARNTASTAGIEATTPQAITISGNTISGVRKIFQESSNKNVTYLTDKINFNLVNNTFIKNGKAVEFGTDSGLTELIKAKLTMSNNSLTQNGKITSIYIGNYPKQFIY